MWSPGHLRTFWPAGDLALDWIRRARKGGDAWGPGEPPNEVAEAYQILIADSGAIRRTWTTAGPTAIYLAAKVAADFPTGGTASVEVAQLGADGEPGAPASALVVIPA